MAQMSFQNPSPSLLRLEPFRGIDVSGTSTQIDDHQSPDMLNMNVDERGSLNKRTGYKRVFATSLGIGKINGLYEYKKADGSSDFLLAHGTKLYKQTGESQPTEIYSGLANNIVHFFTMNYKCYIMDGVSFLVYDGTAVSVPTPYIPTISISRPPAGGGTINEDFNLIGAGFKDSFSADGTATVYQLSLTNLDTTEIIVKVNEVVKTLTTDYTWDPVTGKVTFVTAPPQGTNNVSITAYKTIPGMADKIKKCTFSIAFGGSNDTRMFISGNPNMPEYAWRSGLYDPTYWPENGFYKYPEKIRGFSKQYDYLVVHRESGIHQVSFELDENGVSSFPSKPVNDEVGTMATNSIQIIENNPVSLSKDGVYMLMASNVRDERNVQHLSLTIDRKLLLESSLNQAVSIDYDKKYWLALNGNVYVLDYGQKSDVTPYGKWYIYNNIPASCFVEMGGYLYFGSSQEGLVYRFYKETQDAHSYNDDGQPINAYWKSKPLTFGAEERYKLIDCIYVGLKPSGSTSIDMAYETDKKKVENIGGETVKFNLFDFTSFDFTNFTFQFSPFPREFKKKIKAKKITHFQLTITNNQLNESLTVLSLVVKYSYQSFIK